MIKLLKVSVHIANRNGAFEIKAGDSKASRRQVSGTLGLKIYLKMHKLYYNSLVFKA